MNGNPHWRRFPLKLLWSDNADLKFRASNGETDDNQKPAEQREHHNAITKRQRRRYSDQKHVQRHQQNTTCNYPANKTDEEGTPTALRRCRQQNKVKYNIYIVAALYINTTKIYYRWPAISILLFEKKISISDFLRILVCDMVAMPGKFILFPVRNNLTSQGISIRVRENLSYFNSEGGHILL